jgi:hypothetical protein
MPETVPPADRGPIGARIERAGRWTYRVKVTQGMTVVDCGRRLGRRRAEAKARREMAKYAAWDAREVWTIS